MPGKPTWRLEREAWRSGYRRVAGLDEAGRGCLAGPVVAAAAVLDPSWKLVGVDDSKRLGRRKVSEALLRDAPVVFFAFDILFLDAEVLFETPLRDRWPSRGTSVPVLL